MSNKFTQKAQNTLSRALSCAGELGHTYVGSEHLLLGLLNEKDSIAARILTARGADPVRLRKSIADVSGEGSPCRVSPSDMTPRVKRIIEGASAESVRCGNHYIGTEHLLSALLNESDCVGVRLLEAEGIPPSELKNDLAAFLTVHEQRIRGSEKRAEEKLRIKGAPVLSMYGRDLTEAAREGRLDPTVGREEETDRVIRILSRRQKNNPCLIGEPGVGKTAVVEGLAMRIASGDLPDALREKRIVTLDISSMIAGAKYRGEFEERMKSVMEEVRKNPDIILFIDELHVIIGAGAAEGAVDAANILKPALARGELQLLGATTVAEYRTHIEKDAALERRFQAVTVGEPTEEEAIGILMGLRDRYERHHRLTIEEDAIRAAVILSARYIPDRFLPDKAIDLMDEAASKVRIEAESTPSSLRKQENELKRLTAEKEDAILVGNLDRATTLHRRELSVKQCIDAHRETLSEQAESPKVTAAHVAEIVRSWTGIPTGDLLADEGERLLHLEEALRRLVAGQDQAIETVAQAIRRGRMGLKDPGRPIGSFIFLGQTGVGKTELSLALAQCLFGSKRAMIRLDMSEYMEKHSVSRLIGSPPGYVGYEDGGQLTEQIRRRPYTVVLFDEIEKAHPDVFNLLLQVLEDGTLTDSRGRRVDFSNAVIIMTSNLGAEPSGACRILGFSEEGESASHGERQREEQMRSALRNRFRPEFLNRVDDVVLFKPLGADALIEIARRLLEQVKQRAAASGILLDIEDGVARLFSEEEATQTMGARPLRRAVIRRLEDPLSSEILSGRIKRGDRVTVSVKEKRIVFSVEP